MRPSDSATVLAPAKINLFLHVGAPDVEGYHPLASLVAFADVGDRVTLEPAGRLSLSVTGPFGDGLAGPDNLILRALRALGEATATGEPPLKVTLDKRLPVAAGLGGGSSDAGAALKLARAVLKLDIDDAGLEAAAGRIGADGPMCLRARSAWAEGRGDVLTEALDLPPLPPSCSIRARPRRPARSIAPMTTARSTAPTGPRRPPTGPSPPSSTG